MSIAMIAGFVVLGLIVLIAVSQRRGPRVTEIDRTVVRKDDNDA